MASYKFLDSVGLAHVFDKIKGWLAEKSDIDHTHSYAGSSSVGGAANSANKLNTNAGNTGTPVYFENGIPKACTSLNLEVTGVSESANKDGDGNVITKTYATKTEVTSATNTAKSYTDTSIAGIKYAGSSSTGGAATSAEKINTNAGSATQPVYFANGVPVKTTYTLGASVPSDAKFTDTTYEALTTDEIDEIMS